ncbi:TetR/AcrR family transcriptional regulator [Bradyrhizobium sp.]|uniref:TetR/AcrR family transcriptional regulator n=1 Tax=Bradyrhizobium sp. TaxID=376 RepID=UPI002DDD558C|nr:TetR/AcrR family transcriptional regulator [Bradyrhizobium sp.]HEV2160550.1 TetR/AcrR family transcriptional regulator [Bradyrhizobium sp.]
MGHSQADKALSRQRILDAAALQLRELGLSGVSIGDLMKSAKLTHGGFYGHFSSRDDLIAEALEKALRDGEESSLRSGRLKGPRTLKSFLNSYLSKAHRDNPSTGCAISALAGDVARADTRARSIMSNRLGKYFENIKDLADEDKADDFAMAVMSMIVGAVTLSRVMKDEETSDKLLLAARKAILEYDELRRIARSS